MAHKVKIQNIEIVTHDVKRFVTEKPKGYKFTPGQATEVAINKKGWEDKKRPFTFTSLNEDDYLEFVIKGYPVAKHPNHTGVTEAIHNLAVGNELIIDDPWGAIEYKGKGVFLAGGAGITPFIAIFKQLHKDRQLVGNRLIFSNKTSNDVIIEPTLRRWFRPESLVLTLTREENANFHNGRIDESLLKKHIGEFSQYFYVCGKKQMVSDLNNILTTLGANTEMVVFEK
jgi:ferredoxin-NADP reductase